MRLDYDRVADGYDAQPYRGKELDADLAAFARGRTDVRVLDVGCGTGNQLVADRAVAGARLVGVDRFLGMLRKARAKDAGIGWIQADAARLPLAAGAFDFATMQYAFHHVERKAELLGALHRVLRPGGRFVMSNICPQRMRGWLVYRYFPEALARDLEDFMPPEEIRAELERAGFRGVTAALDERRLDEDVAAFAAYARTRANISQLMTITDAEYAAGLARLETDARAGGKRPSELCLLRITAER